MILRKVAIELTEKQYERLCQVAASYGKTVGKVVQTFAEELPENEVLQDWLGQKQERNFLAYLSEKGKLELMTSLIERTVSYQYIQYKQENEKAKPLIDELQTVRNWKLHGYERRSAI